MRDIVITLIVVGALPMIVMRPYIGVYMWSWLGYMNPHRLTWGFAYNMPFSAMVAAFLFIGLVMSKESKKIPWTPVTITLLIFIAWMSLSTVFALVPDEAIPAWTKTVKIQLLVFVTLMIIKDRKKIDWLVWVIVGSIGYFGIKGGIFGIMTGGAFKVFGPPQTFIEDNNTLALALIMILPLMRYLQLQFTQKWHKIAMTVAMLLCCISIVVSYSRGAFLAGACMLAFMVLKSRKKGLLIIALILALPIGVAVVPQQWFDRMNTIENYEEDQSAMGRINAWTFAFNMAVDRPLVGGGYEAFDRKLFYKYAPNPEDFHDAHSIYFEVLGEHGFVGLGLFLLLGALAWRSGSNVINTAKSHPEFQWAVDLASMVQVSIIGYAVGGAFLGLAYYDLYYHLIAILVLTEYLLKQATQNNLLEERLRNNSFFQPQNNP